MTISKHEIGAPPQLSKGSVSLSLCMIVKDEADQLGDCLSQVRPVVDEIVVVDTGSTDDTREIARKLGARVFEFPWANDFSAARNESLRRATGRYLLWLDADDRIDPEEIAKIQELKAGLRPASLQAYYLLIQSASPLDGESSFYQLRLFPNKPGVRFEGRVHEQVNFSLQRMGIPGVYLPIRIRHTGYEDPVAVHGKYERNWSILQEELKKIRIISSSGIMPLGPWPGWAFTERPLSTSRKLLKTRVSEEKRRPSISMPPSCWAISTSIVITGQPRNPCFSGWSLNTRMTP